MEVNNLNTQENGNIFNKIIQSFKKNGKKSAILLFLFFLFKGILWLVGVGAILDFFNFF